MKTRAAKTHTETLNATEAKANFSYVLNQAGFKHGRIVIKKGRRPTAVILGYDDFQHLADLEDHYESALLSKSLTDDRFLSLADVAKKLKL